MAATGWTPHHHETGLALIEVIVATGILATSLAAGAFLVVAGGRAAAGAAHESSARVLALDKLAQLSTLRFALTPDGQPVADTEADTAVDPPAPSGGTGLSASSDGTLESDSAGYVDYLSPHGRIVSDGPGATIVRRWAVTPLAGGRALRIDVCVFRRVLDRVGVGAWREGAGAVCVAGVRLQGVE